jgi:hypothetical protein
MTDIQKGLIFRLLKKNFRKLKRVSLEHTLAWVGSFLHMWVSFLFLPYSQITRLSSGIASYKKVISLQLIRCHFDHESLTLLFSSLATCENLRTLKILGGNLGGLPSFPEELQNSLSSSTLRVVSFLWNKIEGKAFILQ